MDEGTVERIAEIIQVELSEIGIRLKLVADVRTTIRVNASRLR